MKRPAAPTTTTDNKTKSQFDQVMYQRNLFLSMALNMTWQLAIVVIIPVVGGYKLDQHFGSSPWLTIAGFMLAALGVGGVLLRVVHQAGVKINQGPGVKK